MTEVVSELREAFDRHQAGDLPQAERLYRAVLQEDPTHGEALHLLGVLAHQSGNPTAAMDLIGRAVQHVNPPRAMMYSNLGAAHQAVGDFDTAITHYRLAVQLQPDFDDAQHNLATAFAAQGNHDHAVDAYKQLLATHPRHRAGWTNLGKSLQNLKRYEEAAQCHRSVLGNHPDDCEAWLNLGAVEALLGRQDAAAECFTQLLKRAPQHSLAHFNLGRIRQDQGRLQDAVSHYRQAVQCDAAYVNAWNNLGVSLKSLKQFAEAETCFRKIVTLTPNSATAHFNLGNVLRAQDRSQEAAESYRRGLQFDRQHVESYINLGTALTSAGDFSAAENSYRTALEVCPQSIEVHLNLASVLQLQGRMNEAAAVYERAEKIDPTCEAVKSSALMLPLYQPEILQTEILRRHCEWGARLANLTAADSSFSHDRNPQRRLRIGYVSPDFRMHPVGFFMESILRNHDRERFDVTCYTEHRDDDHVTDRLRPLSQSWRSTCGRTDDDVARMIRDDQIDMLIDLAGHTSGNRLAVFARRPAPVQMTYLGYGTTTGLSAVDYRITDAIADPPGETHGHSEELLRVPGGILCYSPPPNAPEVVSLPAQQSGQVTFGSFNKLSKLSKPTLDVWAAVLRSVPASRLILKNRSFANDTVCARYRAEFVARDIDVDRIELIGPTASITGHLELYGRVDVALDPFPYNGATTTCEALWMGVPVISFRGKAFVERMTASLLTTVGLTEFIVESPKEYVAAACHWAASIQQLAELRQRLRTMASDSPLCDEPAYVRGLEEQYQAAWQRWCATPVL